MKSASVFDTDKLEWLNGQHLSARPTDQLVGELRAGLAGSGAAQKALPHAERAVKLAADGKLAGRSQLARARVLAALGRKAEARKAAERAAKLDPELQQAANALLSR